MNPFIKAILFTLIRNSLMWLAGRLGVQAEDVDVNTAVMWIADGAFFLLTAWGVWDKYKSHQKLLTAQAYSDVELTTGEVEKFVKQGMAPSVMTAKDERPTLNMGPN